VSTTSKPADQADGGICACDNDGGVVGEIGLNFDSGVTCGYTGCRTGVEVWAGRRIEGGVIGEGTEVVCPDGKGSIACTPMWC
jgi:hypothetical protein